MNIWAWVQETKKRLGRGDAREARLAELMHELPSAVVDEAHERVDGMVPEALALARELDEPWVEVFLRHWNLQSRVLHRRRAGAELREAVALLDFANGPHTRGCPQGVCTVQDLAVCYAIRDGPGYVPERLAVARETLERIDPAWGCFDCITGEYFSALLDDDRADEGLAFIDAQIAKAAAHGELEIGFNTRLNRARALLALGRAQQALELLDGIHDVTRYGRGRMMTHRQARIAALLELGRHDEALDLHPPLSAVIATGGHWRDWIDNLVGLVDAGMIDNEPRVGRELLRLQQNFLTHDALWDTARTALIGARLAVERGAREVTRMLLDDAEQACASLRRPELLASMRAEVEAALVNLDAAANEASHAEGDDDPEHRLDRLAALRDSEDGDDDPELIFELAAALRGIGRASMARALLDSRAALGADGDERLVVEFAATLLAEHDHDALDRLFAERAQAQPPLQLLWIMGESLRARGQLEQAIALDRSALEQSPAVLAFRLRLARSARELGDWATAVDALSFAITYLEPGNVDWDLITAATVLGDWARVRVGAERLGLDLPGQADDPVDGPIEIDLGVVRCEFVEASGRRERYWARRTSPCGARIIEIAMPRDPQHFCDEVVFEPSDLDGHLRESNEHHRPCFEVVAITRAGGYRAFLLRGFDPGEELFERLRDELISQGYGFERITREGRTAADPREHEAQESREVPTVAVLIACPGDRDDSELQRSLTELTGDWELPLLCPELDEAADQPGAAADARELLERWQP